MRLNKYAILGIVTGAMALSIFGVALFERGGEGIFGKAGQQTYGITFDSTHNKFHGNSGSTGHSGNAVVQTDLGNDIGFAFSNVAGGPASAWQYMKPGSYFYNTTPIHGLSSLTVVSPATSAGFTVSWGHDLNYTFGEGIYGFSSGNSIVDFDGDLPTYFKLENTGTENFAISSMAIELTCRNDRPMLETSSENEEMGTVSGSNGFIVPGTQVTIVATPKQGYRFLGWYAGESLVSEEASHTFAMGNDDLNYVAKFTYASYSLTVQPESAAKGSVSDSSGAYDYKQAVAVEAFANPGYAFSGWYEGSDLVSESNPYQFDMPYNPLTLTAKFSTNSYDLSLSNENPDLGSVSGEGNYLYGGNVTATATPNAGVAFDGWYDGNGDLVSAQKSYAFSMPHKNVALTARFSWVPHSVAVTVNDGEMGSVSGDGSYHYGEPVTLIATPNEHKSFFGWYDGEEFLSQELSYTFDMPNESLDLTARFVPNHAIVAYSGDETMGTVSAPSEWGEGLEVTVVADNSHYALDYWGDENWTEVFFDTRYTFTMPDHDVELIAFFAEGHELSVSTADTSKGTVTGGYYLAGRTAMAYAEPAEGYIFEGWYSDEGLTDRVGSGTSYEFAMPDHDVGLFAKFWTEAEERRAIALGMKPALSSDGKTITYGLYPQKRVSDSTIVAALNAIVSPESNGYYLYQDTYYAKTWAYPFGSNYFFDDGTRIASGTIYWFKCEPITWRVLSETDGTYYVLSDVLLDAHRYNELYEGTKGGYYANNYLNSEIRAWLNCDFYASAFALADSAILTTTVDNSAATTDSSSNEYACSNTQDKVFLPSYKDYINSSYGFSTSTGGSDTRYAKTTDWARARGAFSCPSTNYLYNGYYWTRSPSSGNSYDSWYADLYGSLSNSYFYYVNGADYGVRPAISVVIA